MTCAKCNKECQDDKHYRLRDGQLCQNCNYWNDTVEQKEDLIIVNGRIYSDAGNSPESRQFLGFGGRKFKYQRHGSEAIVESNNLWGGSEIPELWRDLLPDNASFLNHVSTHKINGIECFDIY